MFIKIDGIWRKIESYIILRLIWQIKLIKKVVKNEKKEKLKIDYLIDKKKT